MELYLIRHGQSTNNALDDERFRVHDPELTELGQQQAEAVAKFLAHAPVLTLEMPRHASNRQGCRLTKVFCSPMHRAMQTAAPIARALNLAAEVWTDIHEHGGIFLSEHGMTAEGAVGYPGMTRGEIQAAFPDYVLPERITDQGWWTGAYESYDECEIRAGKVAEQLRDWAGGGMYRDERVGIVTHGTFLDYLLKALLGTNGKQYHHWHYNTAITRLDFLPSGRVAIRYINRVEHLPPEQVT